eukprot:TRINITY_DN81011_c0_g1_i1.p1 TRINITY_DN81011_c0_g1~~TRINITY_DN81011_c0_g1_i1.p1  ORF type:complete len:294 (+),score=65.55 TRINITY_DN81011_c0_g1_i1:114-995(+)
MFGAPQPQQAAAGLQPEHQLQCLELQKRMEELYPVLQRSSGDRSAAGMANSALQQGFVAYSYSFSDNPQVLQQANSGQFNPAQHVDYAKWVQAVQNNPDPRSCYPEALVGLPALEGRVQGQQRALEETNNALEELRNGFGNLKDHLQAQSLQKLEECRRRHQMLARQLLQVVAAVENHAILNGAARRNPQAEAQLEDRFARLEESAASPACARARVEELVVVLRGLLQRGGCADGGAKLSDGEAERTLQITASQGELLEALQEQVALGKRDVAQFENVLARLGNAPGPGNAQI